LKALTYAGNSSDVANGKELFHAIDEYFRKNFRKLSTKEALDILIPLGEDTNHKLAVLDDKFWVWETLEESMRANV
jgi:hypothetical protein